jgi:hypothetical protein
VYATIGLVTKNKKDHASFMNFIESFFYDRDTYRVFYFRRFCR